MDAAAQVFIGLLIAARIADRLRSLAGHDRQQSLIGGRKVIGAGAEELQRADQLVADLQRQPQIAARQRAIGQHAEQRAGGWVLEIRQSQRAALPRQPAGQAFVDPLERRLAIGPDAACLRHIQPRCFVETDLGARARHQRLNTIENGLEHFVQRKICFEPLADRLQSLKLACALLLGHI